MLQINITDKVATYRGSGRRVVCGNKGYKVQFTFDKEWDAHESKTARFIWGDKFFDVEFTGTTCPMPAVHRADLVRVGVYAGDLSTTTPAVIPCKRSILCAADEPHEENEAHYASEAQEAAKAAKEAAASAQQSAEIAAEAITLVGDIDAALDSILAIQEAILGGEGL